MVSTQHCLQVVSTGNVLRMKQHACVDLEMVGLVPPVELVGLGLHAQKVGGAAFLTCTNISEKSDTFLPK